MAETIDKVTVNKITRAKYNELVGRGEITPTMIKEQVWLFVDDQYVSEANVINWNSKQPALVSGTNIKTINGQSILGSGDLPIDTSGLDFRGYISNQNYINLKNYDLGVYYVMEGTTYSLVDNPGPSQRRMFNNYAIYLLTGYMLVINRNIDDIEAGEYFAYAYGLIDSNTGMQPQYVAFKKSAATSTYGFSFDIQNSQNRITRPLVYVNADQTITSKKTFSVLPESSVVPVSDDQLVNKKYVDDSIPTIPTNISAFNNDVGYITGINSGDVTTALGYTPLNSAEKGANGGVAELDTNGKVLSSQLPSYVDDVVEYATKNDFPATGESGKIYLAINTNLTYRWGGTEYVEISPSLALGETADTAYRGDRGKIAYEHAISPHAPVNAEENTIDSISVNGVAQTPDANKNVDINVPTKTSDLTNDSEFITGMTILSYGNSTWNDFINAYNANKVVYCRASSNSNPATGAQNRLAFMAYVNNGTSPTEVEFQYYRSVATHSDSQQGDQVYVYKLNSSGTWSVIVRSAFSKVVAGTNLTSSYANSAITLNAPTNISAFTNDSGYLTSEGDPVFSASPAAGITSQDITDWNAKQDALVSGTNIKTINNQSLLGSGNIDIQGGSSEYPGIVDLSNYTFPAVPADSSGTTFYSSTAKALYDICYTTYKATGRLPLFYTGKTGKSSYNEYNYSLIYPAFSPTIMENVQPNAEIQYDFYGQVSQRQASISNKPAYVGRVHLYFTVIYDENGEYSSIKSSPQFWRETVSVLAMGNTFAYTPTANYHPATKKYVDDSVATKQETLVSGTNIKTINGESLLGSGDISISGGSSKYVGTITGDGTTTSFTITHNLDSRDVIVQVYDDATYATVLVDVIRDTVNTVQINFTTAPIVDKVYKVIVM